MGLLCDRAQRNHAREDTPPPPTSGTGNADPGEVTFLQQGVGWGDPVGTGSQASREDESLGSFCRLFPAPGACSRPPSAFHRESSPSAGMTASTDLRTWAHQLPTRTQPRRQLFRQGVRCSEGTNLRPWPSLALEEDAFPSHGD